MAEDPIAAKPLAALLHPVRIRLVIAVVIQAIGAVAGVVPFIAVAELGKVLLMNPADPERVTVIVVVAIAALFVRMLAILGAAAITHLADNDLGLDLRRRLIGRLGRVPLGWFTDRNSASVRKAVGDDVSAMHHLVGHTFTDVTTAIVTPVAALVYLFWVDWALALITLLPLLAGIAVYARLMSGSKEAYAGYDRATEAVASGAVEFSEGIAVVKTFGQAGRAHRRFLDAADRFADYFLRWVKQFFVGSAIMELVLSPLFTLTWILTACALFVVNGWMPAVDVLSFVLLGVGLTAPVLALGYSFNDVRAARQAADRVARVLDTAVLPQSPHPAEPADSVVIFEDVTYSYGGETDAVQSVSFTLQPGTVTALIGPSGSGKTTIARLLPRFFDPDAGRITVGGADIRKISTERLYRQVAFVFQEVHMQRASVAENIAMGRPKASRADVEAAASAAQIHDRILSLPAGYDTVVGEGAQFSGGEAQRISIARCLLADCPVVVLDEATAFADPESEAAIQDALSELAAGRTLLVIAHRLRTIEHADQILVLDRGRLVERGTHAELLAAGERYTRLYKISDVATARAAAPKTPEVTR